MQMHYLAVFTNHKIAGLALWQFADIPIDRMVSTDEHRPRGLNNKGWKLDKDNHDAHAVPGNSFMNKEL